MESGSSDSFQSSSGGVGGRGGDDEEYESSRGESISTFLNSQQQLLLSHNQHKNPFFHPSYSSQNLDAPLFLQNANIQLQNNSTEKMGWSRGFIKSSETNYSNFRNFSSTAPSDASSLPSSSSHPLIGTQGVRMINQNPLANSLLHSFGGGGGGEEAVYNPTTVAYQPPPAPPGNVATDQRRIQESNSVGADCGQKTTIKLNTNPKKRTRASRKAPTTVLTTDTANFRQMVQEFTGIHAPPFSANPGGSAFGRRLDVFSSAGASSMRGGHQFYPLRPPAQILTTSNSLLSSSLSMNAIGNPNNNNANASISNNTLGLPQGLKQPNPHPHILSMQNQLLNFQPLVQLPLSPPFTSATRPHHHQGSSSVSVPPSLDELGSFINPQRSSEVERQASWRNDQRGGNLNNE